MKPTHYHYHERTPVSLNTLLLSDPYFIKEWKSVPTTYKLLNHILQWNHIDKGFSEITYKQFHNRFEGDYTTVINTLETLGLIEVVRHRVVGTETRQGECYKYRLTTLCHTLLGDQNRQYLYKLLTNPKEKRRNQQHISRHGYNSIHYGDVRDTLKETIDGISFDLEPLQKLVDTFSDEKRSFTYSLLIDIIEKDYSKLRFNLKDNRVWSPYTHLPSEVKTLISVNNLPYQVTLDIRSCYPSLWATYLLYSYNPNPLPHIDYVNGDKWVFSVRNELLYSHKSLVMETEKYNSVFLNPDSDPKTYLSNLLGIDRNIIKEVLISYYNGKGFDGSTFVGVKGNTSFEKYNNWLRQTFPTLYDLWLQTPLKQTGNNIGKYFETRLMLDQSIYDKASELGLVVGYEYDGMSIYGKDNSNCQTLLDFIENRSVELLGIKLVFVQKDVRVTVQELINRPRVETLLNLVTDNETKLKRLRGRCWFNKNWRPYYDLRDKTHSLLRELKTITEKGHLL